MSVSNWELAKKLMLPFDGGASQIHILGLAKSQLDHALDSIKGGTSDSKITLLANKVLDSSIALEDLCSNNKLVTKIADGQSTIITSLFEYAVVTFDIWGEPNNDTFDLEVWFWADQLFTESEVENQKRFSVLLSLLKSIVTNGECNCILTPCEASDPLEDLEKGYGVLLDIKSA